MSRQTKIEALSTSLYYLVFINLLAFAVLEIYTTIIGYPILPILKYYIAVSYLICLFSTLFFNQSNFNRKFIFKLLIFWTLFAFISAFKFDHSYLRDQLTLPYLILPFTFPFFSRIFSPEKFNSIFKSINLGNYLFISLFIIYLIIRNQTSVIPYIEISGKYLSYANIFMILFITKIPKKYAFVSLIVYLINLGYAIFYARRAMVFVLLIAGIFMFWTLYRNSKSKFRILFLFGILTYLATIVYTSYENSFFSLITERLFEESRTKVEQDFYSDMTTKDFIVGRGIGGTFSTFNTQLGQRSNGGQYIRNGIETGYLDYILKGGIIYLFILISIYVVAIYNGMIRSRNIHSKFLALFIVIHLLELYPSGTILFSLRYLLIWFCVALLYNKRFINLDDQQVQENYIK